MYNHPNPFSHKKYKPATSYNSIKRNRAFRSEKSNPVLTQNSPKFNTLPTPSRVSKLNSSHCSMLPPTARISSRTVSMSWRKSCWIWGFRRGRSSLYRYSMNPSSNGSSPKQTSTGNEPRPSLKTNPCGNHRNRSIWCPKGSPRNSGSYWTWRRCAGRSRSPNRISPRKGSQLKSSTSDMSNSKICAKLCCERRQAAEDSATTRMLNSDRWLSRWSDRIRIQPEYTRVSRRWLLVPKRCRWARIKTLRLFWVPRK